ncbi:hypothetical protein AtNW77_Chr5g0151271 [Arabidopsis thaliana]
MIHHRPLAFISGMILNEEESVSSSIMTLFSSLVWLVKILRRVTTNQQINWSRRSTTTYGIQRNYTRNRRRNRRRESKEIKE